jgi:hypothetical protein
MLKNILLIHAVVEIVVGLLLLWNPLYFGFTDGMSASTIHMVKLYGIIVLIFGAVCYQLWKHFASNDLFRKIWLAIMTFHLLVGFYLIGVYRMGDMLYPAAGAYHLGFALLVAFAYMKEEAGERK